MKLLFDQNLSYKLCSDLTDLFPESNHVSSCGLANARDSDIWAYAAKQGFIIVSQDADFAELAALRNAPPKVIWIKTGNQPRAATASLLRRHATAIQAFVDDEAVCLEIY